MKIYQIIKVILLIFVFSSNLMLGQKNDAPIIKNRCFAKPKEATVDLQILEPQPNVAQTIIENCQEFPSVDSLETGAFFRFAAF